MAIIKLFLQPMLTYSFDIQKMDQVQLFFSWFLYTWTRKAKIMLFSIKKNFYLFTFFLSMLEQVYRLFCPQLFCYAIITVIIIIVLCKIASNVPAVWSILCASHYIVNTIITFINIICYICTGHLPKNLQMVTKCDWNLIHILDSKWLTAVAWYHL